MAVRSFSVRIKPLNTNRKIGLKRWDQAFRAYLKTETLEIRRYFETVARGFVRHEIDITQKRGVRLSGGDLEAVVGVLEPTRGNKIFSHVNWGTRARIIVPRNVPFLIFRPGYKRATTPGSIQVSPPWQKYGSRIFLKSVDHPGIQARRFDKLIQFLVSGDVAQRGRKVIKTQAKQTWR